MFDSCTFDLGGAISYALPKEVSYNRSLDDECLRLRIELMNLLISNSE